MDTGGDEGEKWMSTLSVEGVHVEVWRVVMF